ncbi:TolB family protein [Nocardia salmonicida]|uniref:TolB family protein n=1 Tax=Nocardia salmonicida TaxID=53431 RepID=UPI003CF0E337
MNTASQHPTALVSIGFDGRPGNADSQHPCVDATGRYVAFDSKATNLAAAPVSDGRSHIYLRDMKTNHTIMVDTDDEGAVADNNSWGLAISGDGRYVTFCSDATNLSSRSNGRAHIYLKDLRENTVTLVDANDAGEPSNEDAIQPQMSLDGRKIVFMTRGTNLVPDPVGDTWNVYLRDLDTAQTRLISVGVDGELADGPSFGASVDDTHRFVSFASLATNLAPGDRNKAGGVFIRDLRTDTTTRVSVSDTGVQANDLSVGTSISADGRYVGFGSHADNMQPGLPAGTAPHSYVRDVVGGRTISVDVNEHGEIGNGLATWTALTRDGKGVVFGSTSTNLVEGAKSGKWSTYYRDLETGRLTLISTNSAGQQNNGENWWGVATKDASNVAFSSYATDMAARGPLSGARQAEDTGGVAQIYLCNRTNTQASVAVTPGREAPLRPTCNSFLTSTTPGPISTSSASYALMPFFGYYASFLGNAATAVTSDDLPVPTRLSLTESWRIDYYGGDFRVAGHPDDAVVHSGHSSLEVSWTTTTAGARVIDQLWDRLDFLPASGFGLIYRIAHTVTVDVDFGEFTRKITTDVRAFGW